MCATENALAGKRVVLTRAAEQSKALAEELTLRGARVIVLPCVEFRAPRDSTALDDALSHLQEFDWVAFTSQNAVQFFSRRLREFGRVLPNFRFPRIAALGKATANAAEKEGLDVDFVAREARSGTDFVAEFAYAANGRKILLPQSDQAEPAVADGLREAGANVTPVAAYRTCMPESLDLEALDRVRREGAVVFVFASPSAVHNFARIVGENQLRRFARESVFAAIGPTTGRAIRDAGCPVGIEAAKPTSEAIIEAMIQYFSRVNSAKVSR